MTFCKYQECGKPESIVPNTVSFPSLKQLRKQQKAALGGAYLLAHLCLVQPNSFRRLHFNQKRSFALLCKSVYALISLYNLILIYHSPISMPVNGFAGRNLFLLGMNQKEHYDPENEIN